MLLLYIYLIHDNLRYPRLAYMYFKSENGLDNINVRKLDIHILNTSVGS